MSPQDRHSDEINSEWDTTNAGHPEVVTESTPQNA